MTETPSIQALTTQGQAFLARPSILVIDDDYQIQSLVKELLDADHKCTTVGSLDMATTVLRTENFDLALIDINLGNRSGLSLVPTILERAPETVVIMISGQQAIGSAIEAMRVGAFDYITKPLDLSQILAAVRRGLNQHKLLVEKNQRQNHLKELAQQRTNEIEHLVFYDPLTDLPNQALFMERCTRAMAIAGHDHNILSVMLISLDRLDKISETLGDSARPIILSQAAARLQTCVGRGDTVARFEGNKFALLLTSDDETAAAHTSLEISRIFRDPFLLGDQDVFLTPSIGVSVFPANGVDGLAILKNAAVALCRAEKTGGDNCQFYRTDMNAMSLERLALETSLRKACECDQFVTYYQPLLNLSTEKVVGFEALVRWRHPELGLLMPSSFLDLAEEIGLLTQISEKVFRTACVQARLWTNSGHNLRAAVNISARHFQRADFLERCVTILAETGLDPHQLEFELTETSLIEHISSTADLLHKLHALGISVSIDDFGTGYSSLSYLKQLPIDTVKLDRSFVAGATSNPNDAVMITAIVGLAHNLNKKVCAEGVETEEQRAFLRGLKCDEAQGYLFGKPMPADAFTALLARGIHK